jgi:hypothetical protein
MYTSVFPLPTRDADSMIRKKFSPYEDALLAHLVASNLPLTSWEAIARQMPGRNARQCRERWKHYVSVGCTDRPWTPAEDNLLNEKVADLGPRWTQISGFFYHRSDIQVKSRWLKLVERRKSAGQVPAFEPEVIRVPDHAVLVINDTGTIPDPEIDFKITFSPDACADANDLSWM